MTPYTVHAMDVSNCYDLNHKEILGEGSYAKVLTARRKQDTEGHYKFAVKAVRRKFLFSDAEKQAVKHEIELHARLQHPHIVKLFQIFQTDDYYYFVMQRATRGNLQTLISQNRMGFGEVKGALIMQQVFHAVAHMHYHGVLHSDIKPPNLLLTEWTNRGDQSWETLDVSSKETELLEKLDVPKVMLCDFGLSRKVPDVRFYKVTGDVHKVPFTGVCGSPAYIAPEIILQQSYGKAADLWSLGIILFELCSGYHPFHPYRLCLEENVSFDDAFWDNSTDDIKDLVRRLLEIDQGTRYVIDQAITHVEKILH